MEIKKGIGVSSGVTVAPALVLSDDELRIGRRSITESEIPAERKRLLAAITAGSDDIRDLRDSTSRNLGKETGAIFDFHLGLLNDTQLMHTITQGIEQSHFTAEFAVHRALRDYGKNFLEHPDAYFRERIKDIYDIEKRLLQKLMGREKIRLSDVTGPVVIIARDLTPSQTASLNKDLVKGIAIEAGGQTSHTAIIANSMGIPAVVGLENMAHEITSGDMLIINGYSGLVIIDPDEATIAEHKLYEKRQIKYETSLNSMRDLPARTKNGVEIELMGNIEFPHEVDNALDKGAIGIGLYRTEFLYLASDREPTESDHYAAYAEVARRLAGKPVVIRTLDLGADKYSPFQDQIQEANPFLGCRSIRLCLANIRMFKTQLRAILRASVLGDVRMMFPMITTPMELRQAKMVLKDTMEELEEEGIQYNRHMKTGMMVEVPSTAMVPQLFVRECDFLSIGTNDLIQYTLAVDRGNQRVAPLYSAANPAVIKLIQNVARSGKRADRSVSLCGEMGGDPEFTILLVGLGLRTLSIAPHNIPQVKKVIRSIHTDHAENIARRVMSFENSQQIMNFLREETRKVLPDIFREDPGH
ncbi:MAG TPA: phosphoenolpyruvate--protein phosphotransferase [Phycisphaerae bacterium]|nr:phosphoenolpyruvate--protein phosphotransferase [Phycisphaerae bacterium]